MKNKKIIIIFLVLLLTLGSIIFLINLNSDNKNSDKKDVKTAEIATTTVDSIKNDDGTPIDNPEARRDIDTTGSISISNLSQDDSFVYVRTVITGTTKGICTLELNKTGESTIVKTADIIPITSYYSCSGFNVPKAELPSKGKWNIKVAIQNNFEVSGSIDVQ